MTEVRGIKLVPGDLDVLYERSLLHAEHGSIKKVFPSVFLFDIEILGDRWIFITFKQYSMGYDRHSCTSQTL